MSAYEKALVPLDEKLPLGICKLVIEYTGFVNPTDIPEIWPTISVARQDYLFTLALECNDAITLSWCVANTTWDLDIPDMPILQAIFANPTLTIVASQYFDIPAIIAAKKERLACAVGIYQEELEHAPYADPDEYGDETRYNNSREAYDEFAARARKINDYFK